MPVAESPKKKSLMPSGALRRTLRGAGHALSPVVQIGKEGTSASVLKQVQRALIDHELIKVKIGSECPESRFEVAELLAAADGVQLPQILGRTILVYKRHPGICQYEPSMKKAPAPERPAPKKRGRRPTKASRRPSQRKASERRS